MAKKKTVYVIAALAVIAVLVVAGVMLFGGKDGVSSEVKESKRIDVSIKTDKGEIVMELRHDLMPETVENFVKLADKSFFNGLVFHRVEDWLVQTGDPTGTGSGGSRDRIKFEHTPEISNVRGSVGMARLSGDKDSASSQFYIVKADQPSIDGDYAMFATVTKGMDVVDKIEQGDKMTEVKVIGIR